MPLPSDEKLVQLGKDIIQTFDAQFGVHAGKRPAHARGILLKGEFRASAEARMLTRAPHIQRESVPVVVRLPSAADFHRHGIVARHQERLAAASRGRLTLASTKETR